MRTPVPKRAGRGRAQINARWLRGVDVTTSIHTSGTFQYNPAYMDAYTQLAGEFDLPLRMASQATMERTASDAAQQVCGKGARLYGLFYSRELPQEKKWRETILGGILKNLKPGVNGTLHPRVQTDRGTESHTNSWKTRSEHTKRSLTIKKSKSCGG